MKAYELIDNRYNAKEVCEDSYTTIFTETVFDSEFPEVYISCLLYGQHKFMKWDIFNTLYPYITLRFIKGGVK